jgi:hypothetical protein
LYFLTPSGRDNQFTRLLERITPALAGYSYGHNYGSSDPIAFGCK